MRIIKRTIVLLVIIALVLPSVICVKKSKAASKPKLAKKSVTINDRFSKSIKIKNVKKKQIKKVTVKESKKELFLAFYDKKKNEVCIFGNCEGKSGKGVVAVRIVLKNKKKYNLKLGVKVVGHDRSYYENYEVKYIANRFVDYNVENDEFRVMFSLLDKGERTTEGVGRLSMSIKNENGIEVYNNHYDFDTADFYEWPYDFRCVCYRIPRSDITKGTSSNGVLTMKVVLSDGKEFGNEYLDVYDLPMVSGGSQVSIELPALPMTLNDYDYEDTVQYSYKLNSVRYDVSDVSDGKWTVHLYFSGNKSFDIRGKGQSSSCEIGYKLYKAGSNTVVASGSAYTPAVDLNDSFSDVEETLYDIAPGKYRLEILSTN